MSRYELVKGLIEDSMRASAAGLAASSGEKPTPPEVVQSMAELVETLCQVVELYAQWFDRIGQVIDFGDSPEHL